MILIYLYIYMNFKILISDEKVIIPCFLYPESLQLQKT